MLGKSQMDSQKEDPTLAYWPRRGLLVSAITQVRTQQIPGQRTFYRRILTPDGFRFLRYEDTPCSKCMESFRSRTILSKKSGKGCLCRVVIIDGVTVPAPQRT